MRKIIFICCILLGLSVSAQGLYPDQNEKGKWGYIDDNSTVVIKHKYEYATDLSMVGLKSVKAINGVILIATIKRL